MVNNTDFFFPTEPTKTCVNSGSNLQLRKTPRGPERSPHLQQTKRYRNTFPTLLPPATHRVPPATRWSRVKELKAFRREQLLGSWQVSKVRRLLCTPNRRCVFTVYSALSLLLCTIFASPGIPDRFQKDSFISRQTPWMQRHRRV